MKSIKLLRKFQIHSQLLGSIVIVTLTSCREQVDITFPPFPDALAINSILVADSTIKVHVSLADQLDTSQLKIVNNARIQLYVNHQFIEELTYKDKGIYVGNTAISGGNTYVCDVLVSGRNLIQCEDSIPEPVDVMDLSHVSFAGIDEDNNYYSSLSFSFPVKDNKTSFYHIKLHAVGGGVRYHQLDDPLILHTGLTSQVLFSDELAENDTYTMTLEYYNSNYPDTPLGSFDDLDPVFLEIRSLSQDYYNYCKQYYLYIQGRYPGIWGGVVTAFPLYSNINDGLGIFAGYSVMMSDTINPE